MNEYLKLWNLKYLNLEFNVKSISEKSDLDIATELERFPNVSYPLMCFSGDIVGGNLLFNYIITKLLELDKIKNKAYRLPFSPLTIQDLEMRNYYPIDILLLDTIEFRLLTEYQQSLLNGLIEEITNRVPLTILNITETNLNYAPKLLKDFFKHGFTIGIK
jgi:hypothetical protein